MKLSNICCVSTWMGDRLSIASCIGSMHDPCVVLQYFRLRPVCLGLIPLVQFRVHIHDGTCHPLIDAVTTELLNKSAQLLSTTLNFL